MPVTPGKKAFLFIDQISEAGCFIKQPVKGLLLAEQLRKTVEDVFTGR